MTEKQFEKLYDLLEDTANELSSDLKTIASELKMIREEVERLVWYKKQEHNNSF
jgi:hypothetical protein